MLDDGGQIDWFNLHFQRYQHFGTDMLDPFEHPVE